NGHQFRHSTRFARTGVVPGLLRSARESGDGGRLCLRPPTNDLLSASSAAAGHRHHGRRGQRIGAGVRTSDGVSPMSTTWFDLSGRVAIVTGAGANGGNGHATAVAMAQCGADVFVTDVDVAGLEQTVHEVNALGRRAAAIRCDNGNPDDITATFAAFDRAFDHVDILVNNVGVGVRKRPEDLTLEEWRRVVAVN